MPAPQAAFYLYPDFAPLADMLLERHGITSDAGLAAVLLRPVRRGGAAGQRVRRGRRAAAAAGGHGLLYGDTDDEREAALASADPCALPWIAASLARLEEVLADLTG